MPYTHGESDGTAPGTPPGAVSFHPTVAPISGRDFWRAVAADLLATLWPWPR